MAALLERLVYPRNPGRLSKMAQLIRPATPTSRCRGRRSGIDLKSSNCVATGEDQDRASAGRTNSDMTRLTYVLKPVDWRNYEADGIHVDPGPRPLKRNRYDANANGDVHNLRRELWEVRRRLNVEILREREITEKLRAHGAQEPPNEEQDSEFATKVRVQQLQSELQTERALRRKADALVQDVRRECKTPFVVPALFDAFVEISQMTSDVVEER
ncbi:hypothetical protein GGX14DRAFT_389084 [Mycena pura]|uniref:Uncharacterized protein n=1 Tax=Mycena pura TaxID=153505 RepID=A0AAD6VWZ0_9AGAR|nr:hypothetical protein GGX14DRAFT_389084 [Mycena pura]